MADADDSAQRGPTADRTEEGAHPTAPRPPGDAALLEDEAYALLACTITADLGYRRRHPEASPAAQATGFLDSYGDEFVAAVASIQLHDALPTDIVCRVVHGLHHSGDRAQCEECRTMVALMRARVRRRDTRPAPAPDTGRNA